MAPHPTDATLLPGTEMLRLAAPSCERGIGVVITDPGDPALIGGTAIAPVVVWPDDRGYFLEVARSGRGLMARFPGDTLQVSATVSYPGAIKAFHYHLQQTDCWVPAAGMLQVALVDLRVGSPTWGTRNTMYIGTLRPWQISIPPGVAHGYKVLGTSNATLIYVSDRHYDPADERRLPYDDPGIGYDWTLQHK